MPISTLHQKLRENGDLFVSVSLTGCLFSRYWTLSVLAIFFVLLVVTGGFGYIPKLFRTYRTIGSDFRGIYYNFKIFYSIVLLALVLLHSDRIATVETPLKTLAIAMIIVLNVERFRWKVLIYGIAAGAMFALLIGVYQLTYQLIERPGGDTNPIRFGMIALTLGLISAVGFLNAKGDRSTVLLSLAGLLGGSAAALFSGSRGAFIVLPVVLLILAPLLWQRSRRGFFAVTATTAILVGALLLGNVAYMSTRISTAYDSIAALLTGNPNEADGSIGDRTKLLVLAVQLFQKSPWVGVGSDGWNDAVVAMVDAPNPTDRIALPYNQAHNQYADDLAKGGIIRFVSGFLLLFLPLYLFNKCEPFGDRPESRFALAGVVVSISFIIYCLTESLMILGLPATVHAALVFYLLGACDQARSQAGTH